MSEQTIEVSDTRLSGLISLRFPIIASLRDEQQGILWLNIGGSWKNHSIRSTVGVPLSWQGGWTFNNPRPCLVGEQPLRFVNPGSKQGDAFAAVVGAMFGVRADNFVSEKCVEFRCELFNDELFPSVDLGDFNLDEQEVVIRSAIIANKQTGDMIADECEWFGDLYFVVNIPARYFLITEISVLSGENLVLALAGAL